MDEEALPSCTSRVVVTSFEYGGLEDTISREEGPDEEGAPTHCLVTIDEVLRGVHIGGPILDGDVERSTITSWKSSTSDPTRGEGTWSMHTC